MERLLRRIAYDLHDGPVQALSAAILELEMALNHGSCDAGSSNVERLRTLLEAAVRELREISSNLCPRALEADGLLAVLERFVDDKRQGNGSIAFALDVDDADIEDRLSLSAQIALFRIVQEAVNNALRHASPTRVVVRLECSEADTLCSITDDGCGFERRPDGVRRSVCHGLACMEDRALLLGGSFGLSSRLGIGTTVSVRLPVWS